MIRYIPRRRLLSVADIHKRIPSITTVENDMYLAISALLHAVFPLERGFLVAPQAVLYSLVTPDGHALSFSVSSPPPLLQTMVSDRPSHIRMARSLPARVPENFLTAVCSPLSAERFFDLESANLYFTAQAGGKRGFPDFVVSKFYARNDGTYEKKILTIVEVKRDSTKLREDVIQLTRYVDLGRKQNHVPGLRSYLVFGGDCRAFQHDASGRFGSGGDGGWKRSVFVDVDPPQDDALTNKLSELAIRHWNLVLVFHHALFSLVFRFANSWWALSLFSCWFWLLPSINSVPSTVGIKSHAVAIADHSNASLMGSSRLACFARARLRMA